ncbi:MAG TPA: DUF488 domain-containing protein [Saprospiraceae bacterium]|nr:DUF488 domain-containing protein [Saprospiraceae bacterium]HQW56383.1 DUF488 domain-containing protein [Saprospiraceae bacterium]
MNKVNIRRVYGESSTSDSYRVLVDRLWPRGLTKTEVHYDVWMKEIAPSTELRRWFGHDPKKWKEFSEKYAAEIRANPEFENLKDLIKAHKHITLLYGARDEAHNQAVVLQQLLQ